MLDIHSRILPVKNDRLIAMFGQTAIAILGIVLVINFAFITERYSTTEETTTAYLDTVVETDVEEVAELYVLNLNEVKETYAGSLNEENYDYLSQSVVVNSDYAASDFDVLCRIVEAEAGGLDEKAKVLVANVVMNRVNSEIFPDTITEVVFQQSDETAQFSPISDGRYYTVTVSQSTIDAVNLALSGTDYSEGALFFATTASVERGCWAAKNCTLLFEYNGHVFFKF